MKFSTMLPVIAMLALGAHHGAQAQPKDTLQKIKDSGVINLGGRDASFPFSYKTGAEGDPIGFSADLCLKVVEAVKAKLGMPNLNV
jgi:glutamate/aspartate transport system substrate-binding protein